MYKAIIFDLDNTLLNYTSSELLSMQKTVQEHNLLKKHNLQWHKFWRLYLKNNWKHWISFVNKQGTHQSIEEVLISSFRDTLNLDDEYHAKLSKTYWHYFCNTCIYEEGAKEYLHSIRSAYRLGIISNGIGKAQRQRLNVGQIDHMFESIVVSDEVGIRKPNKEIFEYSLQQLGLSSHEVLYIGDSITDDYQGAKNAGIDFCFYNRKGIKIPSGHDVKYTISKLHELSEVI